MFAMLFLIVLIVCGFAVAVWVLGRLAPTHPGIIDNILWVVCVLVVIYVLVMAFGGHDIPIPRFR